MKTEKSIFDFQFSIFNFPRNQKSKIENRKSKILACALALTCLLANSPLSAIDDTPPEQIPPQVQSAVDRGLQWLAAHQDPATGAWPTNSGNGGAAAAITSLAAMAFMARGHVPGQGPYGDNINHAVDYILSLQQPSGVLSVADIGSTMYDHGISTVMLCEAYGMLDEPRQQRAGPAIAKAIHVILAAQAIPKSAELQGGWRYQPTSGDSDISVSGWQLMALRGAANIGAAVPARALQMGIDFIKRRATTSGGFSYAGDADPNPARTGTGILALQLLGQNNSREALAGGDYLRRNPLSDHETFYFYTVYYCAQAAWQLGGSYWTDIDRPIRASLLARQTLDGSWTVTNAGTEATGGDAYGTSMAILALTVPYRYLPIYQR
jgi:hypothetical protein